jgi:hypothetical protein
MTLLRFLNLQGIAGIAVSLALGILLVIQKGETRHWKTESGRFEQLHRQEQSALSGTIATTPSVSALRREGLIGPSVRDEAIQKKRWIHAKARRR